MKQEIYQVSGLIFEATCVGIGQRQWDKYMKGAVKANGSKIRRLIKRHFPDLYYSIGLEFYNPYESKSKRTKTHFVYVHSGIEYFLKIIR